MFCIYCGKRFILINLHMMRCEAGPGIDCNCSVHDITTPGAAHADDCPKYD